MAEPNGIVWEILKKHKVDIFSKANICGSYVETEECKNYTILLKGKYVILTDDTIFIVKYKKRNVDVAYNLKSLGEIEIEKIKRENILYVKKEIDLRQYTDDMADITITMDNLIKSVKIVLYNGLEHTLKSPKFSAEKGVHNYDEDEIEKNLLEYEKVIDLI